MGRRLSPHTTEGYNASNFAAFVEDSLRNLGTDCLDLVQLHCPPVQTLYRPEVFEALDDLVRQGKIRHYGVSVESAEEALKAIEYPGVQTIQIIFNAFRHRPAELFFEQAKKRKVGHPGARPAGQRPADGKGDSRKPSSPPMTTATSTSTARLSTWVRPSAGVPLEAGFQAGRGVAEEGRCSGHLEGHLAQIRDLVGTLLADSGELGAPALGCAGGVHNLFEQRPARPGPAARTPKKPIASTR